MKKYEEFAQKKGWMDQRGYPQFNETFFDMYMQEVVRPYIDQEIERRLGKIIDKPLDKPVYRDMDVKADISRRGTGVAFRHR